MIPRCLSTGMQDLLPTCLSFTCPVQQPSCGFPGWVEDYDPLDFAPSALQFPPCPGGSRFTGCDSIFHPGNNPKQWWGQTISKTRTKGRSCWSLEEGSTSPGPCPGSTLSKGFRLWSTHAPGALGSTVGLLHADSSGQSQREHPASGAGSAPGRGGGGRASLPPIPTKPWQPGLPETLVP